MVIAKIIRSKAALPISDIRLGQWYRVLSQKCEARRGKLAARYPASQLGWQTLLTEELLQDHLAHFGHRDLLGPLGVIAWSDQNRLCEIGLIHAAVGASHERGL